MPPRQVSLQAMIHPHPKGQITIHPHIDTDMGDISSDHNHTTIPTMTRAAAVTEGTHHVLPILSHCSSLLTTAL